MRVKDGRGARKLQDSRVSGGPNEVETSVDPEVNLVLTLGLLLLPHIGLMLVVNEVDNWRP